MKDLFSHVGFVGSYYEETASFYKQYFNSDMEMDAFFCNVFMNDEDTRPRRMMNQVVRWVGLAKDLQKLRPGRDPLVILCVRVCIESICKTGDKSTFFEKNLSIEGREYIENSFQVDYKQTADGLEVIDEKTIIQNFEDMIFRVRNEAVHDGDYWSSQVFSHNDKNG